jgi:DNA-binding FadR family transcriptional regulator
MSNSQKVVRLPSAEPQQKVKAAAVVADELRREIVTGNLRPGDKLLPEHLLQEQFRVSRPTLREAMRMLEAESLVRISRGQHGGATVATPDKAVLARQVGVFLQREGTTLRDLWEARMVIEPTAAYLVTTGPGRRAAVAALSANIQAARADIEDPIQYAALTTQFAELLVEHCGNSTLRLFAMLLEDIVRRQYTHDQVANYASPIVGSRLRGLNLRGREKLVEFIEAGKAAEAEAHWHAHLQGAAEQISAYRAGMPIDVLRPPLEARKPTELLRAPAPGSMQRSPAPSTPRALPAGAQRKETKGSKTLTSPRKRVRTSRV